MVSLKREAEAKSEQCRSKRSDTGRSNREAEAKLKKLCRAIGNLSKKKTSADLAAITKVRKRAIKNPTVGKDRKKKQADGQKTKKR
jgi:hypothetical protein